MTEDIELGSVIETAILREKAAQSFYGKLAERVIDRSTREALLFLAREECAHEALLESYRRGEGPGGGLGMKHAVDARLVEYLDQPPWDEGWKPEEAFLVAAEQERKAHAFYRDLAAAHPEGEVKTLLEGLAREELAHKEKVEYLYANTAFPQTDGG